MPNVTYIKKVNHYAINKVKLLILIVLNHNIEFHMVAIELTIAELGWIPKHPKFIYLTRNNLLTLPDPSVLAASFPLFSPEGWVDSKYCKIPTI